MKFKTATIDFRWSRESGYDNVGRFHGGVTYVARQIDILYPAKPVILEQAQNYFYVEIEQVDRPIDAHIMMNNRVAYAFAINGIISDEYTVVRFFFDGYYYIFEYRFISRENS